MNGRRADWAVAAFLDAIGYGIGLPTGYRVRQSERMRSVMHPHDEAGRRRARQLEVSRRGVKVYADGSVSGRRALRGLAVA